MPSFAVDVVRRILAVLVAAAALGMALVAYRRWVANETAMRHARALPYSRMPAVVAAASATTWSPGRTHRPGLVQNQSVDDGHRSAAGPAQPDQSPLHHRRGQRQLLAAAVVVQIAGSSRINPTGSSKPMLLRRWLNRCVSVAVGGTALLVALTALLP